MGEVTGPTTATVLSGPFSVATLQWLASVASPTWTQQIATAGPGAAMQFLSQAAAVGSGDVGGNLILGTGAGDAPALPGNILFEFGGTTKAAIDAAFGVLTIAGNGVTSASFLGPLTGFETSVSALWLLPNATARSATDYAIRGGDGDLYLNAFDGAGFIRFAFVANTFHLMTEKGLQINDNVPDFGGGNGVIGMTPSATAPSTDPAGMVLYVDPADGSTKIRGASGDVTIIAIA
jgi:hypothetical protein